MNNPNSNLAPLFTTAPVTKLNAKRQLEPQSIDADEAAIQCLALLTDTDCTVLPAEAFRTLTARNAALLNAPTSEIKESLARQIILLEAAATRFMAKSAAATNTDHSCALLKISLSASRSLLAALGALHQISQNEKVLDAVDA